MSTTSRTIPGHIFDGQTMPIQISYFAIREPSTGKYIQSLTKANRCGTGLKLIDPAVEPPRIFKSKSAATNAMQYWLMGRWRKDVLYYNHEDATGLPEPPDKKEARANKLEVVTVKLVLKDE